MNNGILIGAGADPEGLPTTSISTLMLIIHELGHHYANPLADKYWPQMKDAADKIFPYVKEQMKKNAYGSSRTMILEWMNDLFVSMYFKETKSPDYNFCIASNYHSGFFWIKNSADFMDNFYANRDKYQYIEDFMPHLISFLNYTADNFDFVIKEYEAGRPYITSVYPAIGSNITGFDEIIITFSEPMFGSYGFSGNGVEDGIVKDLFVTNMEWLENGRQFRLILAPEQSEENCTYGLQLRPDFFVSEQHFRMDEKCKNLIFKTMKE